MSDVINWGIVVPIVSSIISGFVTWLLTHLVERVGRRKAEKRAEEAERKLEEIQRRAQAPFFNPSNVRFDSLTYSEKDQPGKVFYLPVSYGGLLCYARNEVSDAVKDGEPVFLIISNLGKETRRFSFISDIKDLTIDIEPPGLGEEKVFLRYNYSKANHGQKIGFRVDFETSDGVQDFHVYETRFGFRELNRIDPA